MGGQSANSVSGGTVSRVAHLLLVEDDSTIRGALIRALTELGHAVGSAPSGVVALPIILDERPDLVVLDLGLPDIDGLDLVKMVRAVSNVPIVVATARDDESVIVEALQRGADDYLVKPFGAAQLDARIRAVLRRSGGDSNGNRHLITVGALTVNLASRDAIFEGAPLDLTAREFDLLAFLAARAGTVVTRRDLVTQVWRQPISSGDKTIDVHLSWLRRKLGETAQEPRYLHTVRGVGVKLAAPAEAKPPAPADLPATR
jgi:DNA-binding response OmpR family regulator